MLDDAVEEKEGGEKVKIGMAVRIQHPIYGLSRRNVANLFHRLFAETRSLCSRLWRELAVTIGRTDRQQQRGRLHIKGSSTWRSRESLDSHVYKYGIRWTKTTCWSRGEEIPNTTHPSYLVHTFSSYQSIMSPPYVFCQPLMPPASTMAFMLASPTSSR